MSDLRHDLHELYSDSSKHSNYQSVPSFVAKELGYSEEIDEQWRGDRSRLAYVLDVRTPAKGELWGDFGANTGFFTLSLAYDFPETQFVAIESNPNHAKFIRLIVDRFQIRNVQLIDQPVAYRDLNNLPLFDVLLHMNVLHHAGHDFDEDLVSSPSTFAPYAIRYLRKVQSNTCNLVFQMGTNWGGNKKQPLISPSDDCEKLRGALDWINRAGWKVLAVAYPGKRGEGVIRYEKLNLPTNRDSGVRCPRGGKWQTMLRELHLDEFPGEFYHRPIFWCLNPNSPQQDEKSE